MKSDCSKNTAPAGVGAAPFSSNEPAPELRTSPPRPPAAPMFPYCAHVTSAGRHCRMLAGVDSDLCPHHARPSARRAQEQRNAEALAADLLGPVQDFNTPGNVHCFLGNVVKQYATKRLDRRDALALGYLCQLLLSSFGEYRKRATRRP